MTQFEELSEAIVKRNKNKKNNSYSTDTDKEEEVLEVAGSESSNTPLLLSADDDADMDLIDQLYFKPRHKPLMGEFAEKWD